MDIWVASTFWLLWIMLQYKFFWEKKIFMKKQKNHLSEGQMK